MSELRVTAFDKLETWRSRRSALFMTLFPGRPRGTGLQTGQGKSFGIIVDIDLSSERITVLEGAPETGQRHVQLELSGASFEVAPGPSAPLTVQFRDGGWAFFVEKITRGIQPSLIKNSGIQ